MNRRLFLGLMGTAIVGAATTDAFSLLARPSGPTGAMLTELLLLPRAAGVVSLKRLTGQLVWQAHVEPGVALRWITRPEGGIVCPQGIASLLLEGPGQDHWATWKALGKSAEETRYIRTTRITMLPSHPTNIVVVTGGTEA